MEFIDHTGHIFSLPSYQENPIGYEYEINPYIFWVDDEYTNRLSINNYYIKPIRILFDETDNFEFTNIEITCDSNVFSLLSSQKIQELLESNKSYREYLNLTDDDFTTKLSYRTAYDVDGKAITYSSDFALIRNIKEILYWYTEKTYTVLPVITYFDVYSYINEEGTLIKTIDSSSFTKADIFVKTLSYKKDEQGNNIPDKTESYIIRYKADPTLNSDPINYYSYYKDNNVYMYAYIVVDNIEKPLYKIDVEKTGHIDKDVLIYNDYSIVTVNKNAQTETSYYYIYYSKIYKQYYIGQITDADLLNTDKDNNITYKKYSRKLFDTEEEADLFINDNEETISITEALTKIMNYYTAGLIDVKTDNNLYNIYLNNIKLCQKLLFLQINNNIAQFTKNYEVHNYCLIPFYVVANTDTEGTWTTNLLININSDGKQKKIVDHLEPDTPFDYNYCHITVGGVFYNEIEELVINGKNMGVELPKDILKALYQTGFNNYYTNEELYNEKIKEYLLNYMVLHGEQGNFNSAIQSLKWFGWGEHLTISKLLQNDNEFIQQYLLDYFDINIDTLHSFYDFKTSTYIKLGLNENTETGEYYDIDFTNLMFGEGKPKLENLFDKTVEITYDEGDITFYRSYYNFMFDELGLKLAALTYYYQKYFLPIHIKIHTASIQHKVYTNDIKLKVGSSIHITEPIVLLNDNSVHVEFDSDTYYFYNSEHYVDENFNEFTNTMYEGTVDYQNVYYINDTCLTIPINIYSITSTYFNCKLILAKLVNNTDEKIFESSFSFVKTNNELGYNYKNFIVYPKYLLKQFNNHYWVNSTFVIYLCVNDKWFTHKFTTKIPNTQIKIGKLEYKYYINEYNTISPFIQLNDDLKFNAYIHDDEFVKMHDIKFDEKILKYDKYDNNTSDISKNWDDLLNTYMESPNIYKSDKYLNKIYIYDLYDKSGNTLLYNVDDPIYDLYAEFFYTEIEYYDDLTTIKHNIGDSKLQLSDIIKYDCFVMHDNNQWYCVFISQQPIYYYEDADLNVIQKEIQFGTYKLKYIKSFNRFLINRMYVNWQDSHNIFDNTDIIAVKISNDMNNIAFNYDIGSKWHIISKTINNNTTISYDSNTNAALISMGDDNNKHISGYYTVKVRYCVDDYIQNQIEKSCVYKIN